VRVRDGRVHVTVAATSPDQLAATSPDQPSGKSSDEQAATSTDPSPEDLAEEHLP
jgi:hypothetical protein